MTYSRQELEALAAQLLAGELAPADFAERLAAPRSAPLGDVTLDLDRRRRCGYPEVIFGEGKPLDTLERIVDRLAAEQVRALITRLSADKAAALCGRFPAARYNPVARTFRLDPPLTAPPPASGRVTVITAGTSDLPVAEEARETLDWMHTPARLVQDVGVAGPHRLIERLDEIRGSAAVVVVAGMEGALPSVVAGHVDCPVFAVPTSVGYGASLGGIAALLSMLNSCAANVAVVNIDAGFKAGYLAGMVAKGRQMPDS